MSEDDLAALDRAEDELIWRDALEKMSKAELRAEIDLLQAVLTEALDLLSDGPGGPRRVTAMRVIESVLHERP